MQTLMNVDKAPTKPTSTASACIYKALVNPQGQKKGRGKKDETRILEKYFIQQVETVYRNIREREREREQAREQKKNKKQLLEGAWREREGARVPEPTKRRQAKAGAEERPTVCRGEEAHEARKERG